MTLTLSQRHLFPLGELISVISDAEVEGTEGMGEDRGINIDRGINVDWQVDVDRGIDVG